MSSTGRSAARAAARRRLRRLAASALAVALLIGVVVFDAVDTQPVSAQAQPTEASRNRECQTVDLLLLMDQSASLRSADPGGDKRREALRSIRSRLSAAPRIHLALIGFNSELNLHASRFEPAAEGASAHPSQNELEASLNSPRSGAFTDYGEALRGSLEVFDDARVGSCRELVWFTDGVHDTAVPSTAEEAQQAEQLHGEVCRSVAPRLADLGVRTQVVLLGDSFKRAAQSQNSSDRRIAELSAQMMSAVTADTLIAGRPVDAGCDVVNLVSGDVLEGEPIDLPNSFIEPLALIRGLRRWPDCASNSGRMRPSDRLPAGAYIDEMEILSYGGTIERYRLGEKDWVVTGSGARKVDFDSADLADQPSGWVLQLEVAADPGGDVDDVTLSCFSKPVDEPLRLEGRAVDPATGETASWLTAGERYDLRADAGPYGCDDSNLELRIETLDFASLGRAECDEGGSWFSDFEAVPSGDQRRITEAPGRLAPFHAETMWPDEPQLDVSVELRPSSTILSDQPLECFTDADSPRVEIDSGTETRAPRARIVAAECRLTPQPGGETSVDVDSSPSQPDYRLVTEDGEPLPQPLLPEDGPQEFNVVSDDMTPGDLPEVPSTVEVTASFRQADGRSSVLGSEVLNVGPSLSSPIECVSGASGASGALSQGAGGVLPRLEVSPADAGADRLVVAECRGPRGAPAEISVQSPTGTQGGSEVVIVDPFTGAAVPQPAAWAADDTEPFEVAVVVPSAGFDGSGTVTLRVIPQDPFVPLVATIAMPEIQSSPQLACGLDGDLPEISLGLPLRVVVSECRVDPPDSGTIAVEASAAGPDFGYAVESSESGASPPWTLSSDSLPLRLLVVSEELGVNGWDYHGIVTLRVAAIPERGVAQVYRRAIDVPPGLLNDQLSCEPLRIVNAEEDEVPAEPLRATLDCGFPLRVSGGDLSLAVTAAPNADDLPAQLSDWRFLPASELLDDGRILRFGEGETISQLRLVTSEQLPNDRIASDAATVTISAEWTAPGWQSPLTATTTTQYTLDLWQRSILWLAVLIALLAALATLMVLYGVVAATNRLPKPSNFWAYRLEFSTHRDERGKLHSSEIERFDLDSSDALPVAGGAGQKQLKVEDLKITARRPKWWQLPELLRGGWGELEVRGISGPVAARPAGPQASPAAAATAPEQFQELAVVALQEAAEPRGMAFLLVPKNPRMRSSDSSRQLKEILADLTPSAARTSSAASAPVSAEGGQTPHQSTEAPRSELAGVSPVRDGSASEREASPPPRRGPQGPPPRQASQPPPRKGSQPPPPRERPR